MLILRTAIPDMGGEMRRDLVQKRSSPKKEKKGGGGNLGLIRKNRARRKGIRPQKTTFSRGP